MRCMRTAATVGRICQVDRHLFGSLFGMLIAIPQIPQRVAQAAAWHLNNDMSWQQLAAKRIVRAGGSSYPYFDLLELKMAVAVAEQSIKAAGSPSKTVPPTTSPVQTVSQAR